MKSETEKFEEAYLLGRCYEILLSHQHQRYKPSYDAVMQDLTSFEQCSAEITRNTGISISKSNKVVERLIEIGDIYYNNEGYLISGSG